jgi:hypothetical protein
MSTVPRADRELIPQYPKQLVASLPTIKIVGYPRKIGKTGFPSLELAVAGKISGRAYNDCRVSPPFPVSIRSADKLTRQLACTSTRSEARESSRHPPLQADPYSCQPDDLHRGSPNQLASFAI